MNKDYNFVQVCSTCNRKAFFSKNPDGKSETSIEIKKKNNQILKN
jgi:hypothetical protein